MMATDTDYVPSLSSYEPASSGNIVEGRQSPSVELGRSIKTVQKPSQESMGVPGSNGMTSPGYPEQHMVASQLPSSPVSVTSPRTPTPPSSPVEGEFSTAFYTRPSPHPSAATALTESALEDLPSAYVDNLFSRQKSQHIDQSTSRKSRF
ncbi:hypothetical protein SCAR479_10181 [Seiridium cardinale]|uniref:Uncharacterized protein n=1 Tax=Seiridium cardinale TaxID=138064 RepID=A0ABR2XGX0_9PEZI